MPYCSHEILPNGLNNTKSLIEDAGLYLAFVDSSGHSFNPMDYMYVGADSIGSKHPSYFMSIDPKINFKFELFFHNKFTPNSLDRQNSHYLCHKKF
jgi:hypothetical protein